MKIKFIQATLILVSLLFSDAFTANAQYCETNLYSYGCGIEWIQSVSTTGGSTNITNLNTGCTGSGGVNATVYTGTNMRHTAAPGQTVNYSVVNGATCCTEAVKIFVDWNIDGDWLDAGEDVAFVSIPASGTGTGSFTVPVTATPGLTRMRVRLVYGGTATSIVPCTSTTYGEAEDYEFMVNAPCNGMPSGNVSAPVEICPNDPFNVGITGLPQTGMTYQWKTSTDGINFTNYTGPLGFFGNFTDQITAPKWYKCTMTCIASGMSYTTPVWKVGIAPFYYCYCKGSKATNAAGIDIGKLNIATLKPVSLVESGVKLNNGPGGPLLSNTAATGTYNDFRFTMTPIPMYRDSIYKFTVNQISSSATFAAATAAIYIDYNRNGFFEVGEQAMLKTTANLLPEPGVVRDTFTMPSTAGIGITGMRVILRSGSTSPDTCTSYTEGETEDYLVDIRYEACDGPANAGTISFTDSTMCPGYVYSIADSTHEKYRSEISWNWQYSPDGLVWANLPNSANKDTINNIMFNNTIYYRVRMACGATQDTSYSPAQRIGLKPAYKCYCYSLANGGSDNDSSDIGGLGLGSLVVSEGGPHLLNETAFHPRQDYTDLAPLNLWTENRYQLLVYHTMPRSVHADAKITVFMDYNNDKQYNIPEERVGTWFSSINNYTLIDSIMIPDSVIIDVPTGMRVILNNNVGPNFQSDNACGVYTSGETEDFIVMFRRSFPQNVANIAGMDNLGMYPNPTNGKFRIQFSGNRFENLTVTVRSITGQQVLMNKYSHKGGQFSEELDMSGYAKGVYLVELKANGEKMTRKLVVQ